MGANEVQVERQNRGNEEQSPSLLKLLATWKASMLVTFLTCLIEHSEWIKIGGEMQRNPTVHNYKT